METPTLTSNDPLRAEHDPNFLADWRDRLNHESIAKFMDKPALKQMSSLLEQSLPYMGMILLYLVMREMVGEGDLQYPFNVVCILVLVYQVGNQHARNHENGLAEQRIQGEIEAKQKCQMETETHKHDLQKKSLKIQLTSQKELLQTPVAKHSLAFTGHDFIQSPNLGRQTQFFHHKQSLQLLFMVAILFAGLALVFFGSMFALSIFSALSGLCLLTCERLIDFHVKRTEFSYLFLLVMLSIGSQFSLTTFATGIILDHMHILLCVLLFSASLNVKHVASSKMIFLLGLLSAGAPLIISVLYYLSWFPTMMVGLPITAMAVLTCFNALSYMHFIPNQLTSIADERLDGMQSHLGANRRKVQSTPPRQLFPLGGRDLHYLADGKENDSDEESGFSFES